MKLKEALKESGSERNQQVYRIENKIQKMCLNFLKNMDDNTVENSKDLAHSIMRILHEEGVV